ncbi:MAG TPA: prepilin peptidase [Candidatus Paceibacterota bacterium]|nr:prepilin peptidase [Candidatus Paceibacterota bacterium]
MLYGILFVFGLVIGSFLNVVSMRYREDQIVGDPRVIGGRSHCPHCGKTLHWYELVPVASFIIQRGRCRGCGAKLSWQYPAVELLSACIFAFVPMETFLLTGPRPDAFTILSAFWVLVFELLLLIAVIDFRLGIIPDELNAALGVVAIFMLIAIGGLFGVENHSLFGSYAVLAGFQASLWENHLLAALGAFLFFALLVAVTKGRGMGLGDVKLAIPLGLIFGWPDIAFVTGSSFVIGAFVGLVAIIVRRKTMKQSLPFAPFLAIGAALVFFLAFAGASAYFRLVSL